MPVSTGDGFRTQAEVDDLPAPWGKVERNSPPRSSGRRSAMERHVGRPVRSCLDDEFGTDRDVVERELYRVARHTRVDAGPRAGRQPHGVWLVRVAAVQRDRCFPRPAPFLGRAHVAGGEVGQKIHFAECG